MTDAKRKSRAMGLVRIVLLLITGAVVAAYLIGRRHQDTAPRAGARLLASSVGPVKRQVMAQPVRAPAWIDGDGTVAALLPDDEIAGLTADQRAMFAPAAPPATRVAVRRLPGPPARWDRVTSSVRFQIEDHPDAHGTMQVGRSGHVELPPRLREALVVPAAAVIPSADGAYVLAVTSDRRGVARRRVQVGGVSSGLAPVISGLREGELVVVSDVASFDGELGPGPAEPTPPRP